MILRPKKTRVALALAVMEIARSGCENAALAKAFQANAEKGVHDAHLVERLYVQVVKCECDKCRRTMALMSH